MALPKVLLLGDIETPAGQEDWKKLGDKVQVVKPKAETRQGFIEECKGGSLDGVSVIYRTFHSFDLTGRLDDELVGALPKSVRFICHNGAGYDQVDVPACTQRAIHVSHVPTAVDDSSADTAAFLILGCLRGFNQSMASLRRGAWRGSPPQPLGHDPEGKVLGILGMGGIGRNLARKMRGFGMKVVYHNRRRLGEKEEEGAVYVGLDELLRSSDVLSVHVPLNAKTHHFLSTAQFAAMKKGAVVVNTARGAVIDEAAMVEALESGHIASVGLDVFENEPDIHPGLLASDKVMLLPHMGTWSHETLAGMETWNIKNVRMAVTEGRLGSRVPEQEGLSYD